MATSFNSSSASQPQVSKALLAFYQKPVAQVSTELFFTIGAVVFFAVFAIRPTILTMTDLIKEIEDKRTTSEALSKKVASLSSVQVEYFALQNQFPLLDEIITQEPETKKILKIIEKLAVENQLSVSNLSLKEVPIRNAASTLEFRQKQPTTTEIVISTNGSYTSLRNFLEQLLFVRPLITLDTISLAKANRPTNDQGEVINQEEYISATLRLELHYYGKGSETPSASATPEPSI